jgi:uncharacterized membrane-anchored protein YhcB (DUF1043 family)
MEFIAFLVGFFIGLFAKFVLDKNFNTKEQQTDEEQPKIKTNSEEDELATPFPSDPNKPLPPKPPTSN